MEEKLDQRLVDVAGLMHILCMSRPQLQRMINDEDVNFPKPIMFGKRKRRWRIADINKWLEQK
jgi:predicted DNA-binding transcriptional regulator AlpA|tara:strand:- start:2350 stop:2538 length:189 start_codon:yes stop_codon:yes gene_type:complete